MFMMAAIMIGIIAEKEFEAFLLVREEKSNLIPLTTFIPTEISLLWLSSLPQDMLASDKAASILYPSDRGGFKFFKNLHD